MAEVHKLDKSHDECLVTKMIVTVDMTMIVAARLGFLLDNHPPVQRERFQRAAAEHVLLRCA